MMSPRPRVFVMEVGQHFLLDQPGTRRWVFIPQGAKRFRRQEV